jgi:hypothetical protein
VVAERSKDAALLEHWGDLMSDGCHGDSGRAGGKGGVNTNPAREGVLQELASSEKAQRYCALTTALKERSEGEEAAANSRSEAEGGASSSHIAMLGSTGRRFLALHIWHSSLRSPP